ncbi:MAG: zinc-dependent metalloprotease, partial [Vicinamibacterales bacterium]
LTEAVGDADAVRATTLGLKNLERVADTLLEATTTQPGEPYRELTEVYGRLVAQWMLEMNHVTALVGGLLSQQRHIGQDGVRFTPVPRARQVEAVQFLLAHAFATPSFLIKPDLLRRMEPTGALTRVRNAQNSVMNALLQTARLERLIEQAALDGDAAYAPGQFLTDLRRGIWSALATPARPIDPFRRNVQIVYLDTVDNRLHGGPAPDPAVRALLRGELRTLRAQIVAATSAVTDRASRLHLEDARDRIDEMLDPRAMRPPAAAGGRGGAAAPAGDDGSTVGGRFDYDNDMLMMVPETCWPDYVVR